MTKLILLLFIMFPTISYSSYVDLENINWINLSKIINERVVLGQSIQFENKLVLNQNTEMIINDYELLPINVAYLNFSILDCNANQASKMILVLPKNSDQSRNREVGVQLQENCLLEIYVETRDLYSVSFFHLQENNN